MKFIKRLILACSCAAIMLSSTIVTPYVYAATDNTYLETSREIIYGDFSLQQIPEYDSEPYAVINDNIPFFTESEITAESFEQYSEQDKLGRSHTAFACIGSDLMPTEERGKIGNIKPAGWHTVKYSCIDGKYLYNRCHLIGYQLTGENANEKNLITGTRYLNVEGMLPFENMVTDYIEETDNHVMYRVTPIYQYSNLLCYGVLIEAYSVEDNGRGVCFNVFCYNVQPGIQIDYKNGNSKYTGIFEDTSSTNTSSKDTASEDVISENPVFKTYILNTSTKKFHSPSCSSVSRMSKKNKKVYAGSYESLVNIGYSPCKKCCPKK